MAKPNYSYEKRQRELAKKKKKEEKAARKAQGKVEGGDAGSEASDAPEDALAESTDADSPTVESAGASAPGAA